MCRPSSAFPRGGSHIFEGDQVRALESFHGKEGTLKRHPQGSAGQLLLCVASRLAEKRVPRLRTAGERGGGAG